MTLLPPTWRRKIAYLYLAESLTTILGVVSVLFGASIVTMNSQYVGIKSFQVAFAVVDPQWWGLGMVGLGMLMVSLLGHSRRAAAVPTFCLGIVLVLWVVPIIFSPGFAPSAPIVYSALSALTLLTGLALLVEREET